MKNEFEEIWGRIKLETKLKSLQGLANIVKISQPAVSEMKAKGKFPPGWAYLVAKEFGLLTEWVMTGEGPKRINEKIKLKKINILEEVEEWLCEEIEKNPRRESWFELQMIDCFESFKKWKEEKEESEAREASTSTRKVA